MIWDVCSFVHLDASVLDGTVEGRYERSMEKSGVGSYFMEEGQRTSRSRLLRNEGLWTLPNLQVLRMMDGRIIGMKDTCPEDVNNTLLRRANDMCWQR